jgi:hypothetical protein
MTRIIAQSKLEIFSQLILVAVGEDMLNTCIYNILFSCTGMSGKMEHLNFENNTRTGLLKPLLSFYFFLIGNFAPKSVRQMK